MDTRLQTQPESYRQTISRSLMLYRLSFGKIAIFAFLLSCVVFIPRVISDILGRDLYNQANLLSWDRIWLFILDISSLVFFIAILWHMYCVLLRINEPMLQDLQTGLKKVLSVFVAAFIQCLLVSMVALLAFGIIMLLIKMDLLFNRSLIGTLFTTAVFFGQMILILYTSTLFFFIIPLIAIENKGIIKALEKSVSLVWNHAWRVFSTQITPWATYIAILIVLKYLVSIDVHIFFTTKNTHSYSSTIINIVLFTLFIPWVAALSLSQLKDLELRKSLAQTKH